MRVLCTFYLTDNAEKKNNAMKCHENPLLWKDKANHRFQQPPTGKSCNPRQYELLR